MKNGFTIEDFKLPKNNKILQILHKNKNKYTCFVKRTHYQQASKFFGLFDIDIIWDKPCITTEKMITRSCIADEYNIKRFIKAMEQIGEIKSISYKQSHFTNGSILSELTDMQRKILLIAKKEGYYHIPRKINGKELAEKIGISKVTLNEHLRKIENYVINALTSDII
jgi:predicted DNA binding protein